MLRWINRLALLSTLVLLGLAGRLVWQRVQSATPPAARPFDPQWVRLTPLEIAGLPVAERWDAAMGSELAALTYNAQPFRITRHLGDDLNGIGGYNSDLGDAVYAAAMGKVVYKGVPGPGWGKVVIVAHLVKDETSGGLLVVQSMYAHLLSAEVTVGQVVQRGQVMGKVGTAEGQYLAHLHLEVRRGPYVNPSLGYADAPLNRESPERFIGRHRGAAADLLNPAP